MASAAYTGQTQQTTAGLVNAMAADASWCPAVQTCVVPSVDTIQQLNATGTVAAWGSLVEIGATPLTANISITLPASAGNVGKTVTFKRLDSTAFTVTLNPAAGDTGEVTTPTALNAQFGALTVEVASATKYEQVSNISAAVAATTNTLVAAGAAITSTVDGVAATITPAVGVIQDGLGFNAAGALVKATPAATTNTLTALGAALTSTVDGVAATVTPATGVIQDNLGFNAAGVLVKAAPVAGSILTADSVQTANRTQDFGGFSQTWNNLDSIIESYIGTSGHIADFVDGTETAQASSSAGLHNFVTTDSATNRSAAMYVTPNGTSMELSAVAGQSKFALQAGTVAAALGKPQTFLKSYGVSAGTAVAGQVLTLMTAATGEAEYVTLPTSTDTVQTAAATGTTNITAWGSVVLLPTLTGNITLLYPSPAIGVGKTVKVVQTGVPNAFTITHTPAAGTITFTNAAGELAAAGGAITVEAVDNSNTRQVSNAVASATSTLLTYGRVHAAADLPATSFTISSPGTKVPFSATVYNSGTTFSGTDSIIPSQAGRYRVSWFMMSGSSDMQADGTFHVVQNGVSLGNIFVDMMQAAGVNQVSNFLDLNLAAGQAVELRYQPAAADTIPWGRGSYFDITQLPTAVAPVVDTVAEFVGPNYAAGTVDTTAATISSTTALQFMSLAIPSAGTWSIEWSVLALIWNGNSAASNGSLMSGLYDSSGVFVSNSELSSGGGIIGSATASNFNVQGTRSIIVTTTGAETYNVKVWDPTITGRADAGSSALGRSYMLATKIAGQLPATGQSADYINAYLSVDSVTATNTSIKFDVVPTGNIPYNSATGSFTLTAGKTYRLQSNLAANSSDGILTAWYNVTSGASLPGSFGRQFTPTSTSVLGSNTSDIIFTPSVTTLVQLRNQSAFTVTLNGAGGSGTNHSSAVTITQLGTTANINTLSAADNSAAGYIDFGNMRMQWGLHDDGNVDTTTVTLPAPFLNNTFVVTATSNNGVAGSVGIEAKTTTSFDVDRASTTVTTNIWGWQAIGFKP